MTKIWNWFKTKYLMKEEVYMAPELWLAIVLEYGYWKDSMGGRFSRGDVLTYSPDFAGIVNPFLYGIAQVKEVET